MLRAAIEYIGGYSSWKHGVRDVEDASDNHVVPKRDVPVGKDASDTTNHSGVLSWLARERTTATAYPGTFRSLISHE